MKYVYYAYVYEYAFVGKKMLGKHICKQHIYFEEFMCVAHITLYNILFLADCSSKAVPQYDPGTLYVLLSVEAAGFSVEFFF